MKKIKLLCVNMLALAFLVACGGAPTLDTGNNEDYVASLKVMYDDLSEEKRNEFLGAVALSLLQGDDVEVLRNQVKGTTSLAVLADYGTAGKLYASLSQVSEQEKQLAQMSGAEAEMAKELAGAALKIGKAMFANLEALNGLTADEIIAQGTAILEEVNQ